MYAIEFWQKNNIGGHQMDAKELKEMVKKFNSHKEEMFDKCAEKFVLEFKNKLESLYEQGQWLFMTEEKEIGVKVIIKSRDFCDFDLELYEAFYDRFVSGYEELGENGWETIKLSGKKDEINSKDYDENLNDDVVHFEMREVPEYYVSRLLEAFCEPLIKRGFNCYVTLDGRLLVGLRVEE